jgi:menaquinone-specific isochorismate synthase
MEDFITTLVSSYTKFISEKSEKLKEASLKRSLLSYATEIKDQKFEQKIDQLLKSFETSFYFCSPEENFSFIAIDDAYNIIENGNGRFAATDKKIKDISDKFINNWENINLPLFAGAMKFTVEHYDDNWKDFNDSSWFVPEIVICTLDKKHYLIYNFFSEQGFSKNKLIEKFRSKAENIFDILAEPTKDSFPKIANSVGRTPKDKKKWKLMINEALDQINEGIIKKIVLARKIELTLSEDLNITKAITELKKDYPNCRLFAYHKGKSTFFGATPELITKLSGGKIHIDAIAGSIGRGKTELEDLELEKILTSNKKDLDEHRYVLEHFRNVIDNFGENITLDESPSVKRLKNIQHLLTKIVGDLKPDTSVMNILRELHPTPAICGLPKEAALNLIKRIENQRRGLYSGIIGWFNFNNEGEFAVAIRSAVTYGNKLVAYAGSGIVEGSEPESEFEETEMKFKPILSLFDEKKD